MGTAVATIDNANPWNNQIRALCDTGGQSNLITRQAVKRLGLKTHPTWLPITATQETATSGSTELTNLHIRISQTKTIKCTFFVVGKVICDLPIIPPAGRIKPEFNQLQLADPDYPTPAEVDALFGVQVWIRIVESK